MVVSVFKFEKKNVNSKNGLMLVFKQKFKKFTNKIFFSINFFFQIIFFPINFFFNEFFFQLILTEGTIGNATLNFREEIVIFKM